MSNFVNISALSPLPVIESGTSIHALMKMADLKKVAQRYFQDTTAYSSGDIRQRDVRKAIMYAHSKIKTRAKRNAGVATAKAALYATGATVGGIAGSVAPGAGNVLGATIAGGSAASLAGVGYYFFRGLKKVYKKVKGTQGAHRHQAAIAIVFAAYAYTMRGERTPEACAGYVALAILIGAYSDKCVYDSAVRKVVLDRDFDKVAGKLKSV